MKLKKDASPSKEFFAKEISEKGGLFPFKKRHST